MNKLPPNAYRTTINGNPYIVHEDGKGNIIRLEGENAGEREIAGAQVSQAEIPQGRRARVMAGMSSGTGNHRAPLSERGDDLYETPEEAVWALLAVEDVPKTLWKPACGPGAIVRALRSSGRIVHATDLVDYECPGSHARQDFLMETVMPVGIKAIVTNPPFKLAEQFVAHARKLCPKVFMLLRLAFLESERRRAILEGGDLARVHVFRKRLPMMHRAGWEGRKANSGMAFAWFVWDAEHNGPTTLNRISWEDQERTALAEAV